MNKRINQKEFDEKVNKAMKYGITSGLLIGLVIAILEHLTNARGKIAEYSIVVLSVAGFVIFVIFAVYALLHLRGRKKLV